MSKAVLFDGPGCIGCRACEDACKKKYNLPAIEITGATELPAEPTTHKGTYTQPAELSAYTWIKVRRTEIDDAKGFRTVHSLRKCMHCIHPACVAACPVGALHKDDNGATVYDDKKCIGCRYCMLACPFGVPTYEWDKPVPFIRKCIFCPDLLAEEKPPACVTACSKRTKCITIGEREAQLALGRKMIAEGKGKGEHGGDKYVDHIYGEKEVGGTNWLYLSEEPFEISGLRTFDSKILPADFQEKSWAGSWGELSQSTSEPVTVNAERAMLAVPFALPGVAIIMSGLYWVFKRKDKLIQENVDRKNQGKVTK